MSDPATDAIMDKIAKLLAKANGTNNENEAAIFAAKAAEMLAEHNLTEAQLGARDASREQGPIGEHDYAGRAPDVWRLRILQGCAKLYFCTLIGAGKRFTFVGREHNARVAIAMSEYLIATVKRMAWEYDTDRREQHDFRRGAGDRLYERLVTLYREKAGSLREAMAPVSANPDNLPALYAGETQAVDAYLADRYGKLGKSRSRGHSYKGSGAYAGRSAADRISLNTQVKETRTSRLLK